jgi:hypothetical protein
MPPRLADLAVVDVAVVRAVHADLEAVGITGVGKQLARRVGSWGGRLFMSATKPLMPGATISAVGVAALRITGS